jgi:hypothetical protein
VGLDLAIKPVGEQEASEITLVPEYHNSIYIFFIIIQYSPLLAQSPQDDMYSHHDLNLQMAMAASFLPSTISFDHFDSQNGANTRESQEIMYYQGHAQTQHPQHQQQQQHINIPFPPAHQAPLVLSDYQMHNDDTPSSMDDQFSPTTQNDNGKRPSLSGGPSSSRKRARKVSDFDPDASIDANSPQDTFDPKEGKPKATRGARYVPVVDDWFGHHILITIRLVQRMHCLQTS